MDRRQQKTRKAIFQAFSTLLETKRFENITVQQIIDEANIGRSTFYAHFETKDDLLKAMCTDIFQHVFSEYLEMEPTHDFSENHSFQSKVTHLLYHLKDNEKDIVGIFTSESSELFVRYFQEYLAEMFSGYQNTYPSEIPQGFVQNYLVGSFVEAVKWWISEGMHHTPEEIARYYLTVISLPGTT